MVKKAKQLLSILGRNNATYDCIARTQSMLDSQKNAREVLDSIIKEILHLKAISDEKIKNAINFMGVNDMIDAKMCIKCFEAKEISEFYFTQKNKGLHSWCRACRREYDKSYKQRKRR